MNKNKELLLALGATLAAQVLTSGALMAVPVLAPAASVDVGIPATAIGAFIAIAYAVAALSAPVGGAMVPHRGGMRVSQACLVLSAAAIAAFGMGHPAMVVLAAVLAGAGYGPVTPASSALLIERTPDRARNLVMSIRQSGVPIGGALAGAIVPWLILGGGWQAASMWIAGACLALALLLQTTRSRFDTGLHAASSPRPSFAALIRLVASQPELLRVSIASCAYAAMQTCFTGYLVVFMIERAALSLVGAGALLSAALIAGIVGRILWGVVADWARNARAVLAGIGITTAACAAVLTLVTPAWPGWALFALAIVYGVTAVGWNGVYVAEVARVAPNGQVALATGASLMFTYAGPACGPFLFWAIVAASGSYAAAFITAGCWTLAAALLLLKRIPGSVARA